MFQFQNCGPASRWASWGSKMAVVEHCQIFRMTFSQCDYGYTLYLLTHVVMYRSTWHYIISSVLAQLRCSLLCRRMILLNQVLSSCALHTSTLILYPSLLVQFINVFTAWLAINWWRCHEAFCILFHVRQRIAIFFFYSALIYRLWSNSLFCEPVPRWLFSELRVKRDETEGGSICIRAL